MARSVGSIIFARYAAAAPRGRVFGSNAETITPRNIDRVRSLGGGIAIQHRMAYQGEAFIRRYGREAARSCPPVNRMLAAGIRVIGYDLSHDRRDDLAAAGGVAVNSAAEVFRRCDTIVLSLPDSAVVRTAIDSVGTELRKGLLIVDTSTGDPQDAASLGEQLAAHEVDYLDATVAGSSAMVREGQAIALYLREDAVTAWPAA